MSEYVLQVIWYFVIGASVVLYAVLDGFDLGAGCLHLFVKKDEHRRIFLNAIGPVWDGNAVWFVVIIGALFAGFPPIYATVMSSFYTLIMILIAGIIFRAVAIEFRSKKTSPFWRNAWDYFFACASILITFVLGVILGNLVKGIPLNEDFVFVGNFWGFFSPYTIVVGFFALSLFMMHGCIYLIMKTQGELHEKLRHWVYPSIIFFVSMFLITTIITFIFNIHMIDRMKENNWFFIFPALTILSIANVPREIKKGRDGMAFIFSSLSILFLFTLFGVGTFPIILRSSLNSSTNSLTILDSSSIITLKVLFSIAVIGVPLVLAYAYYVYRVFRGKVKLADTSY